MVPSYFVQLEKIPLTPNGKVDRKVLPEPGLQTAANFIAPRNKTEETLVTAWSETLSLKKEKISIDGNFFEQGGHSLKAALLASKIHKALNVKVTLTELFKNPTIRTLAEFIKNLRTDRFLSLEVIEKKEYYPLSPAQKRLYILDRMNLGSTF
jgi:acyl carrier protein